MKDEKDKENLDEKFITVKHLNFFHPKIIRKIETSTNGKP